MPVTFDPASDPVRRRRRSRGRGVLRGLLPVLLLAVFAAAWGAEPKADPDAAHAVPLMTPGINIGNTFDNTAQWEVGWGQPLVTQAYVQSLARVGFRTVRLPVAWDTYAVDGRIQPDKLARIREVVGWILDAGMYCAVNIHWDGGWIDSGWKERYPKVHVFSPAAEVKFTSYWQQLATAFQDAPPRLIFEGFNEESDFSGEGSLTQAQATLGRVNQLFVDTVRRSGGANARRLLIIAGYTTDIDKTCSDLFVTPKDTVPGRLFVSLHFYSPPTFALLEKDADWGKAAQTWGSPEEQAQFKSWFDRLDGFTRSRKLTVFLGEFCATGSKEYASRLRWTSAVAEACVTRGMVPVLWDTGGAISRKEPYAPSDLLRDLMAQDFWAKVKRH